MPKTNINDIASEGWRAEVTWRPADRVHANGEPCGRGDECATAGAVHYPVSGHVQIASVNQHSTFEFPPDLLDHGPNGEELYGDPEPFDGWRVTLDEAGIDRMIAALTNARRQAFGGECGQRPCDHAPDGGNHPSAGDSEVSA